MNDKFVNNALWHTEAANPAGPGFLIGEKDVSTAERERGRDEFGKALFKEKNDGTIGHPEFWHLTDNGKAWILVPAWMGTVKNHMNWLVKDYDVETLEAELAGPRS